MPSSKLKYAIATLLKDEGLYSLTSRYLVTLKPDIRSDVKYFEGKEVIDTIKRVSRPGLRIIQKR